MAIESDLKQAERVGVSISKEKLIQIIRDARQQHFIVVQGKSSAHAIVPVIPEK